MVALSPSCHPLLFSGRDGTLPLFQTRRGSHFFYTLSIPLIIAYAISIGSALVLSHIPNLGFFAHLQVDFHVVLITGIIWLTGDFTSPFPFLYNLAVMNGAILLFYRGAFFTAAFSSLCYLTLLTLDQWIRSRRRRTCILAAPDAGLGTQYGKFFRDWRTWWVFSLVN